MGQIVHIFRKDVRRHWWEIILSMLLLGAFAWKAPREWAGQAYGNGIDTRFWLGLLGPLVPIAWAFLILRGVQEESLVGDRQFWVTRPYEWGKLLAAKLLLIITFVSVPLFIANIFLLLRAGFVPSRYISGLLGLQLLWVLFLISPAVTLGAITSNIGQSVLAVLGVLLYIIGVSTLASVLPNQGLPGAETLPDSLQSFVLISTCLTVVLWQYARRRTVRSRILVVCAAGVLVVIMVATPYRTLIARAYPQTASGQLPVQLAFDPEKPNPEEGGWVREKNKVHIRMPLTVSGIAQGSVVIVDGTMMTIQAPGGLEWNSGWHALQSPLLPSRPQLRTHFDMDRDFFERVKSTPVKARLSFALTEFHEKEAKRIVTKAEAFPVPGEGRCSFVSEGWGVTCVFPLREPFTLITAASQDLTCTLRKDEAPVPSGLTGYGWIWNRGSGPELGISPIQTSRLYISDWGELDTRNIHPRICPGTPLRFSTLKEGLHTRSEIEIDGLRLVDYQLKDLQGTGGPTGLGIGLYSYSK
jgi:hypothetical protein